MKHHVMNHPLLRPFEAIIVFLAVALFDSVAKALSLLHIKMPVLLSATDFGISFADGLVKGAGGVVGALLIRLVQKHLVKPYIIPWYHKTFILKLKEMSNAALDFLQEIIQRLKQKSPKFFQRMNAFNGAVAIIASLPDLFDMVGYHLPVGPAGAIISRAIALAAAYGYFNSKLSIQRPVVTASKDVIEPLDKNGEVKPQPSLPFTSKVEAKKVAAGETSKIVIDAAPPSEN